MLNCTGYSIVVSYFDRILWILYKLTGRLRCDTMWSENNLYIPKINLFLFMVLVVSLRVTQKDIWNSEKLVS